MVFKGPGNRKAQRRSRIARRPLPALVYLVFLADGLLVDGPRFESVCIDRGVRADSVWILGIGHQDVRDNGSHGDVAGRRRVKRLGDGGQHRGSRKGRPGRSFAVRPEVDNVRVGSVAGVHEGLQVKPGISRVEKFTVTRHDKARGRAQSIVHVARDRDGPGGPCAGLGVGEALLHAACVGDRPVEVPGDALGGQGAERVGKVPNGGGSLVRDAVRGLSRGHIAGGRFAPPQKEGPRGRRLHRHHAQ